VYRTGENRLSPGQDYNRGVTVPTNTFSSLCVCGRALSLSIQTLLT